MSPKDPPGGPDPPPRGARGAAPPYAKEFALKALGPGCHLYGDTRTDGWMDESWEVWTVTSHRCHLGWGRSWRVSIPFHSADRCPRQAEPEVPQQSLPQIVALAD